MTAVFPNGSFGGSPVGVSLDGVLQTIMSRPFDPVVLSTSTEDVVLFDKQTALTCLEQLRSNGLWGAKLNDNILALNIGSAKLLLLETTTVNQQFVASFFPVYAGGAVQCLARGSYGAFALHEALQYSGALLSGNLNDNSSLSAVAMVLVDWNFFATAGPGQGSLLNDVVPLDYSYYTASLPLARVITYPIQTATVGLTANPPIRGSTWYLSPAIAPFTQAWSLVFSARTVLPSPENSLLVLNVDVPTPVTSSTGGARLFLTPTIWAWIVNGTATQGELPPAFWTNAALYQITYDGTTLTSAITTETGETLINPEVPYTSTSTTNVAFSIDFGEAPLLIQPALVWDSTASDTATLAFYLNEAASPFFAVPS